MGTPVEKQPIKTSAMSKQSIIISVLALALGVAAVGGFYYYLDAIKPKGDPAFEKKPATTEEERHAIRRAATGSWSLSQISLETGCQTLLKASLV